MARQQAHCPHCDAEVHPKARECPECGAALKPRGLLLPVLVGAFGVAVALAAGAVVWVLLSPDAPPQVAATAPAPSAAPAPAPPPAATVAPAPAAPVPPAPAAAAPASVADAQLPLPTASPEAQPAADETARRDFARATQENFTKNGLDLKVSTTGPASKGISLVFNFPAKMAVELIAGGPFPRQCRQRGFTSIAFSDPTGAAWAYDIATDKLTTK